MKQLMGNQGLVGVFAASTSALSNEEAIYSYYDHPELHQQLAEERLDKAIKRFHRIMAMEVKPDFLCVGGSGTLVFQTVKIFRQLAFPAVKRVIEMATEAGMPTHVHSCGPESQLVKIMATETSLTLIDPLDIPPMGDCNLRELKQLYGERIILKGNLHTTRVMLHRNSADVAAASRQAIDDVGAGGGFILSTGDQCSRDTPFENLRAMIETARTYGNINVASQPMAQLHRNLGGEKFKCIPHPPPHRAWDDFVWCVSRLLDDSGQIRPIWWNSCPTLFREIPGEPPERGLVAVFYIPRNAGYWSGYI